MTRALLAAVVVLWTLDGALFSQTNKASRTQSQPLEKTAPRVAQAYAKTALDAMTRGDLETAKREFGKVLNFVPGNVPTTINLGLIAYREKDYARAEALLKKVARTEPENGLPWLLLGMVAYDQDKLDAALAALAQAVFYAPKDARAHHYLGVTIGKKGWYSGAEDELRKAIAIDPGYGEAHYNLAVFYLQRKPPAVELARRHYEKSLNLGGATDPQLEEQLEQ